MARHLALAASVLLVAAGSAPPDRFDALFAEISHSDARHYGCLEEGAVTDSATADAVLAYYQRTRGVSEATARAVLASLFEFEMRPSGGSFDALRQSVVDAGALVPVAEDACRCVYLRGQREGRVAMLSTVKPPALGSFWAARVLHERGGAAEAADHYRRSLEANSSDPRTRLFYAIDLIDLRRPAEALDVLAPIPSDWASAPVTYWRARALLDSGHRTEARRMLDTIADGWKSEPTTPEISMSSTPVQPERGAGCLLGRAQVEEGDTAVGRATLEKHGCASELARLDLQEDRPFDALLELNDSASERDPRILQALSRVGACDWARRDLPWWHRQCEGDYAPKTCPLLAAAEIEVNKTCPPEAAGGDSTIDPGLAARLAAPRLAPFEERHVPAERRWVGKRSESPLSAAAYPALADRRIVALSPPAERMFAVSVSEDLDPRGEVSAGGYWLHLSADHGRSWDGPYYLGFAQQFPYVVLAETRMPAFDEDDHVNIEVERREVDESTITFPPVGLRAKNYEKDLYLSVDLAAVERDSDGDGLTDLVEEKLGLDPQSADTDGDGLPDAADPLPLQPRLAAESSERVRLLATVLPYLFDGPPAIQQSAAAKGEESAMSSQGRTLASARTLFVSGSPGVLPHAAGIRAILLPPAMLTEYTRKFGATYPMELPDIAFDRDRQRALVRFSFHWRGGSLLAELKGGTWVITPRGSWIT